MAWNLPPDRSGMGGVFGAQDLPPWMTADGLSPVFGSTPAQASPEDPFERAAYRWRGGRPMAPTPDVGTPAEMLQGASMLLPGAAGMITRAPKLATAALVGYYGLSGTDPANGQEADPVKQLQTKLRDAGYYSGPIDGKMGPATSRAQQAQQQADQLAVQQQGAEAARATADAQRQAATAQLAETQRQSQAAVDEQQKQAAGQERYQQAEGNVGPVSSALRSYGAPIGTTLGIVAGPLARWGVTKASNAISRRAANEAEALFAPAAKGTPARVANANEFYRRGGAGAEVPYLVTPGQAPGFAANPAVAGTEKLFQPPSALSNGLKDAGITAGFAAESAGSKYMGMGAEADLKDALEAARKDPSQMNIDRVQTLKDKAAFYDAAMNLGRAGAVSYPASMLKMQRAPSVPSMAGMEAERMKLEALLRKKTPQGLGAPRPSGNPVANALAAPPSFTGPSAWRQRQFPEGL